jgi:ribosome hibernation promoting factor
MDITIRSHHTQAVDGLREHAEKKLARLERYLHRVGEVVVEVEHEETRAASDRFGVRIAVRAGATVLRAEERSADPRAAFDAAAAVLSRQAERHGKRLQSRHRGPGGKEAEVGEGEAVAGAGRRRRRSGFDEHAADERIGGKVVRVRRSDAKSMSAEEALEQMELMGEEIFLFIEAGTLAYAALYRRRDGELGMVRGGE